MEMEKQKELAAKTLEKAKAVTTAKVEQHKKDGKEVKVEKSLTKKIKDEVIEKEAATVKAEADKKAKIDEAAKLEAQAKEDETILASDEKTLDEPKKKRKQELLAKKKAEDEKPENLSKKLADLESQLKAEKEARVKDVEAQAALKQQIADLEKKRSQVEPDEQAIKKQLEDANNARVQKYLSEDRDKPREQRREMSKDDLNDWYLEDPVAATEWMQQRTYRRNEEISADKTHLYNRKNVDAFVQKQNQSVAKLIAKFPGVSPTQRSAELAAQGLNAFQIHETHMKENAEYREAVEIAQSDPKYLTQENGPELVLEEMLKRRGQQQNGKAKTVSMTEEELKEKLEEAREQERIRLSQVDESPTSSAAAGKAKEEKKTAFEKQQEALAAKAGISPERLKAAKERRQRIPGAGVYKDDE